MAKINKESLENAQMEKHPLSTLSYVQLIPQACSQHAQRQKDQ